MNNKSGGELVLWYLRCINSFTELLMDLIYSFVTQSEQWQLFIDFLKADSLPKSLLLVVVDNFALRLFILHELVNEEEADSAGLFL